MTWRSRKSRRSDPALLLRAQRLAANDPIGALGDIERAQELGERRGTLRGEAGLAEDRAARGAALGRVYDLLGFEALATVTGAQAVEADPTNPDAHYFLSDAFLGRQGFEVAQSSEFMLGQILSPPNRALIQPRLGETRTSPAARHRPDPGHLRRVLAAHHREWGVGRHRRRRRHPGHVRGGDLRGRPAGPLLADRGPILRRDGRVPAEQLHKSQASTPWRAGRSSGPSSTCSPNCATATRNGAIGRSISATKSRRTLATACRATAPGRRCTTRWRRSRMWWSWAPGPTSMETSGTASPLGTLR